MFYFIFKHLIELSKDGNGDKTCEDGYISIDAKNFDATSCDGGEYELSLYPEVVEKEEEIPEEH